MRKIGLFHGEQIAAAILAMVANEAWDGREGGVDQRDGCSGA